MDLTTVPLFFVDTKVMKEPFLEAIKHSMEDPALPSRIDKESTVKVAEKLMDFFTAPEVLAADPPTVVTLISTFMGGYIREAQQAALKASLSTRKDLN